MNGNPTAVIMNWCFTHGDCELQTYTLSDQKREPFLLKLSCMQGLILLQFQAEHDKRSAKELAKFTGLPGSEVEEMCLHFLESGLFKQVEHLEPPKYILNEHFNADSSKESSSRHTSAAEQKKQKYIDLMYPTKTISEQADETKIKKLGLDAIAGDKNHGSTEGDANQAVFVENLRFRIDARICKNLKDYKKMTITEMQNKVVVDLGMHMTLPTA